MTILDRYILKKFATPFVYFLNRELPKPGISGF